MLTVNDLQFELRNLYNDNKKLLDKAIEAGKPLEGDDRRTYDQRDARIAEVVDLLDQHVKAEKMAGRLDERMTAPPPDSEPNAPDPEQPTDAQIAKRAFIKYLRNGGRLDTFTAEERRVSRVVDVSYDQAGNERAGEARAVQVDSQEAGGYLVAPEEFVNQLIEAIRDRVYIRARATNRTLTSAQSIGVPSLDARPEDATWSGEITSADEDTAMDFGKREMAPNLSSKLIKISQKLLRMSSIDAIVRDQLAYKFGITEEKSFLTGTGSGQPLGLFIANASGIPTGRDTSTGNTTTTIGADNLFEVQDTLKEGYQQGAVWIMHRNTMTRIRKVQDGNGNYIFERELTMGRPNTLLGKQFLLSEYAPNTYTSGNYLYLYGDLSFYWVVTALNFSIQVLNELYARTNQVGYIGRMEVDGAPVLAEAFVRGALA